MDGQELAKQTLDQIPKANATAKRIVGLVKEGGKARTDRRCGHRPPGRHRIPEIHPRRQRKQQSGQFTRCVTPVISIPELVSDQFRIFLKKPLDSYVTS